MFCFQVGFVCGIAPYRGSGIVSTKMLFAFVKKKRKRRKNIYVILGIINLCIWWWTKSLIKSHIQGGYWFDGFEIDQGFSQRFIKNYPPLLTSLLQGYLVTYESLSSVEYCYQWFLAGDMTIVLLQLDPVVLIRTPLLIINLNMFSNWHISFKLLSRIVQR